MCQIGRTAQANPEKVAISCAVAGDVTFSGFLRSSLHLASNLDRLGVPEGHRVAIFMRRSAGVIVAMHAVLAARCAYVPIYHGTPDERLDTILTDCEPAAVICDAHTEVALRNVIDKLGMNIHIVVFDAESYVSTENYKYEEISTDWAMPDSEFSILYTSGSSGTPKGVVSTHGNLKHYVDWGIEHFQVTTDDVIFCTAPFHFDMSVFDIYVSLAAGAELVIATEKDCIFPKVLIKKLSAKKATVWKAVSSLLSNVATSIDLNHVQLPQLRALIFAGERLPTQHLITWMNALPNILYFNAYGPTEATGVSCCYEVSVPNSEDEAIPIGKGRFENEIMIFSGKERIETSGTSGEIVIAGPGVAKGYWRDVDKTRRSFVSRIGDTVFDGNAYRTGDMGCLDDAGNIVFLGRIDRQIKHQGYRIELDDIEAALHRMPGISGAAVVFVSTGKSPGLAAYYTAENVMDAAVVRVYLASQLPAYMVPKTIIHIEKLPRSDRGKLDYSALLEALA